MFSHGKSGFSMNVPRDFADFSSVISLISPAGRATLLSPLSFPRATRAALAATGSRPLIPRRFLGQVTGRSTSVTTKGLKLWKSTMFILGGETPFWSSRMFFLESLEGLGILSPLFLWLLGLSSAEIYSRCDLTGRAPWWFLRISSQRWFIIGLFVDSDFPRCFFARIWCSVFLISWVNHRMVSRLRAREKSEAPLVPCFFHPTGTGESDGS